jgi:hypothetical protein
MQRAMKAGPKFHLLDDFFAQITAGGFLQFAGCSVISGTLAFQLAGSRSVLRTDWFRAAQISRKLGIFPVFRKRQRGLSLQLRLPELRLRGGARSLALTFLRPNSLLTGKTTGNLRDLSIQNRTPLLYVAHSARREVNFTQIEQGINRDVSGKFGARSGFATGHLDDDSRRLVRLRELTALDAPDGCRGVKFWADSSWMLWMPGTSGGNRGRERTGSAVPL